MVARVFVTGAVLAGCGESVRKLGRLVIPPFDPAVNPYSSAGGWEARASEGGSEVGLLVRAKARTPIVYDPVTDQKYHDEAEFLRVADFIVYVVDSQAARLKANLSGVSQLQKLLARLGRDPAKVPVIFQLNKRDLPNVQSEDELKAAIRWQVASYVPTKPRDGTGIYLSLHDAAALLSEPALGVVRREGLIKDLTDDCSAQVCNGW